MGVPSAWTLVGDAAEAAGVSIAALTELEDSARIGNVLQLIWGEDLLDTGVIRAAQHAGGLLYGAEAEGEMVGFVFGFAGFDGGLHLHSHILGVVPEWQDRGVGYALKLAQRARCLDAGIDEVRWTYDPLVTRNARFNLVKLGCIAERLFRGFYGEMTDMLNKGDRSDRFEIRWHLASDRVEQALRGELEAPPKGEVLLEAQGDPELPEPKETGAAVGPGAVVAIPRDHAELRSKDPDVGRRWREMAADVFDACFQAGLVAAWMTGDGRYVFERPAGPAMTVVPGG
jgi:predicted GNAT superfamily acetyltransferase